MIMEELNKIILEDHISNSFQGELGRRTELKNQSERIRKLRPGVCQYCNKWFADRSHLYAHIRIHTGEKPFVCNVCHKRFNQSNHLRRHLVVHTERKPLNCNVCGKQYIDKLNFSEHVRAHTGAKPYSCPICNKKYAIRTSFVHHKLSHGKCKINRFFCQICKEGFSYENLLKFHMRIHNTEVKSYQCTLCRRVFSQIFRFHSHLMSLHNIKIAFQCKTCNKCFPDKNALGQHYLSHKKDTESISPQQEEKNRTEPDQDDQTKKYSFRSSSVQHTLKRRKCKHKNMFFCQICQEGFVYESLLKYHMRIHNTEVKSYQCTLCRRVFSQIFRFHSHLMRIHNIKIAFLCKTCNERFLDKNALGQHYLSHKEDIESIAPQQEEKNRTEPDHGDQTKKYPFRSSSAQHALKRRKRKHKENRFFCQICQEGFVYESLLKYHMRIHNTDVKSYQCKLCKRVFSRRIRFHSHLTTIHNIKIALQCKICNEHFSDKQAFVKHYLSHDKESVAPQEKQTNRIESNQDIENPNEGSVSVISSVSQKEVEIETETEQDFENDITQNRDPSKMSSVSEEELEMETGPGQHFDYNITQNEHPCEVSSCSQKHEIKIEPEQYINNKIIKNRYLCGICYEEFSSITSVHEHVRTHTL